MTQQDLLTRLLQARSPHDVRSALEAIGDHADVELDVPFGDLGLFWHPFGGRESNISSIGLGTKSGRSLTERVTNAQDALLEAEARASGGASLPTSPWQAAEAWFKRPRSDRDAGAHQWDYGKLDQRIQVVLLDSGIETAPTVDVFDDGVGLTPSEFPNTILSLQAGNKIKNRHLIGAFGQGGAATLAFADYTILVSRNRSSPRTVAFTIIRVLRLSDTYKEDCYGYLATRDGTGNIAVPSVERDGDLEPYQAERIGRSKPLLAFKTGTIVRHIAYKLNGLEKGLGPSPGNLWHYLHVSMFDPILPFRLADLRGPEGKDRVITGSRTRLLKHAVQKDSAGLEDDESGTEILHYRPMEFVKPREDALPCIGIEYWAVVNYQKRKGAASVLRARSSDLFVSPRHPIIGTLNGQNQGELPSRLIAEAGLSMVSNHIVVHVDASRADSRIRRELFSTSREGFKDGPVLSSIVAVLKEMLEEDEALQAVERKLTEDLLSKETQETKSEVKREVARLLKDAGLDLSAEGTTQVPGEGEEERTRKKKHRKFTKQPPLPTLPYPNVTRFEMVWPKDHIEIPLDDFQSVLIETDADSQFDREGRIAIRTEPPGLLWEMAKAPLRGGRMRWRLKAGKTASVGNTGKIIATLTKPDGVQMSDEATFQLMTPITEKSKTAKGKVPPFDIVGINPEDDPDLWARTWPDLDENADQTKVTYCLVAAGGKLTVFYSEIYGPYTDQLNVYKGKGQTDLAELFTRNYEIWIGYHAILQHQEKPGDGAAVNNESEREALARAERDRVARIEVAQARRVAEIQHQLVKKTAAAAAPE